MGPLAPCSLRSTPRHAQPTVGFAHHIGTWRAKLHESLRRLNHPHGLVDFSIFQHAQVSSSLEIGSLLRTSSRLLGAIHAALLFGWLGVFVCGRPFGTPAALYDGILAAVLVPWLLALGRNRPSKAFTDLE